MHFIMELALPYKILPSDTLHRYRFVIEDMTIFENVEKAAVVELVPEPEPDGMIQLEFQGVDFAG